MDRLKNAALLGHDNSRAPETICFHRRIFEEIIPIFADQDILNLPSHALRHFRARKLGMSERGNGNVHKCNLNNFEGSNSMANPAALSALEAEVLQLDPTAHACRIEIADMRRRMDEACDIGEISLSQWRVLLDRVAAVQAKCVVTKQGLAR
ncbi:hypothetical protein LXA47_28795 [Massilia sp. P8910]|uniref:hypothetical protein n=1 Tax=Massilia antarctica TaxID=2765360 RepID=UPI001E5E6B64|nr:hypothetical protein [Massilia antarctica]MCE3607572.1 hypothetical protein [Massilia antarctica]